MKYAAFAIVFALCVSLLAAQDYYQRASVTVDSWYIDNEMLYVEFNLNNVDSSGSFQWVASYDHRKINQKNRGYVSFYQGDTTASAEMYVGAEIVMRSVRVMRVRMD